LVTRGEGGVKISPKLVTKYMDDPKLYSRHINYKVCILYFSTRYKLYSRHIAEVNNRQFSDVYASLFFVFLISKKIRLKFKSKHKKPSV